MSRARRDSVIEPRGLSREDAAAYVGIGTTLFDRLVEERVFPSAKQLAGHKVWDRRSLDIAFDRLPGDAFDGIDPKPSRWQDVG